MKITVTIERSVLPDGMVTYIINSPLDKKRSITIVEQSGGDAENIYEMITRFMEEVPSDEA